MPQGLVEFLSMLGQVVAVVSQADLHGFKRVLIAQMLRIEQHQQQGVYCVRHALCHHICPMLNMPPQDLNVDSAFLFEHADKLAIQIIRCKPRLVSTLLVLKARSALRCMAWIAALDDISQTHNDWRSRLQHDLATTHWAGLKHCWRTWPCIPPFLKAEFAKRVPASQIHRINHQLHAARALIFWTGLPSQFSQHALACFHCQKQQAQDNTKSSQRFGELQK
mmetsp:Transcript_59841/g.118616  ORF Transcript_59841/g.118616 Transcript_59841/m.118616 type:complete len:222 (-) Transcript_59841:450-1115(-)